MPLTFLFPLLRALNDGRVLRRATVIALRAFGILTLVLGVLSTLLALFAVIRFNPTIATFIGTVVASVLWLGVIVGAWQVYEFHARQLDQLKPSRFTVIPIAAELLRVAGDLIAIVSAALGLMALLAVFGLASAGALAGGLPGLPIGGVAAVGGGLQGLISCLTFWFFGFCGLVFAYFMAESLEVGVEILKRLEMLAPGSVSPAPPAGPAPGPLPASSPVPPFAPVPPPPPVVPVPLAKGKTVPADPFPAPTPDWMRPEPRLSRPVTAASPAAPAPPAPPLSPPTEPTTNVFDAATIVEAGSPGPPAAVRPVCWRCGTEANEPGAVFCGNCGTRLN
jgi:hypothetical protein